MSDNAEKITTESLRAALAAADRENNVRFRDNRFIGTQHGQEDPLLAAGLRDMKQANDNDSAMMLHARRAGVALRRLAGLEDIDLDGDQWIDPQRLEPHVGKLSAAFNAQSFSPAYELWGADCRTRIIADLCAHHMFRDMAAHWHDYDDEARLNALHWFTKACQLQFAQDVMTPRVVCVSGFSEARTAPPHPRITRGGHGRPEPGRRSHDIVLNVHPDAKLHDFFSAVETAFHENLHVAQAGIALSYAQGLIRPGHPLHREARLFAMAFADRVAYLPNVEPAYRAHPTEQDTFAQTEKFLTALKAAMPRHRVPLPALTPPLR